jgi:hypothetical protein
MLGVAVELLARNTAEIPSDAAENLSEYKANDCMTQWSAGTREKSRGPYHQWAVSTTALYYSAKLRRDR